MKNKYNFNSNKLIYRDVKLPFIILLFVCIIQNLTGQNKQVLVTNVNSNWAITKKSQPLSVMPLNPPVDWMTSSDTGLINNSWTYNLAIANIASSQVNVVNQVGNNAKPVWITKDVCNYTDDYTNPIVYYLRNTFEINENCNKVKSAKIRYIADNLCRIYVNGIQVKLFNGYYNYGGYSGQCTEVCGQTNNNTINNPPTKSLNSLYFTQVETADIQPYLRPGVNVIAVEAINIGGCGINYGWFCGNIEIEYEKQVLALTVEQRTLASCIEKGSFIIGATGGTSPYLYQMEGGSPQKNGDFSGLDPGTYLVHVSDSLGCESTTSVLIEGNITPPVLTILNMDNYIDCSDQNTFIKVVSADSTTLYSLDNAPFSGINYFSGLTEGIHEIVAKDTFGCESVPFSFEVYKDLNYRLDYDSREVCFGESVIFRNKRLIKSGIYRDTTHNSLGCDTIFQLDLHIWDKKESFLDYLLCDGDSITIGKIKYTTTGYFTQLFKSSSGCDSTLNIRIDNEDEEICARSKCNFFIPNVFSPNHDGVNDYFKVETQNATINSMVIYNRWGGVVYSSNALNPQWDGNYGGKRAQVGVYVYLIRGICNDNTPIIRYGDVTLIK